MTVIHANDPTTQFLTQIYSQRDDIIAHVTEEYNTTAVKRAIRNDNLIMMLGHGTQYGLLSKPDKKGKPVRFLVDSRFVDILRSKICIGIWCFASDFASKYFLHGLFSGMIISELQEAIDKEVPTTQEEITIENEKFAQRLKYCIETFPLSEIPLRMKEMDDIHSPLTTYNYNNLFFFE